MKQGFNSLVVGPLISVSLLIAIGFVLFGCDGKSGVKKETVIKNNPLTNITYSKNSFAEDKTMIKNKCSIEYDSSINAFIMKISGKITQEDIYKCQQNFEKAIAEHCKNKKYNILFYMDHESHTLDNVRLIRLLTSTPQFKNSLNASAAVFTNSPNPGINGNEGNFSNTEDAVEFLKRKNLELLKDNK